MLGELSKLASLGLSPDSTPYVPKSGMARNRNTLLSLSIFNRARLNRDVLTGSLSMRQPSLVESVVSSLEAVSKPFFKSLIPNSSIKLRFQYFHGWVIFRIDGRANGLRIRRHC